ncbi:MAG: FCSD flavin-binding domain-containing protein [Geminicoccaceae bacterium]
MRTNRRRFSAGAAAIGMGVVAAPSILRAADARVVVIGGGAAGATAAKYIARDSKGAIDVTLIEPKARYVTCFYSNLYLAGYRTLESITHDYSRLRDKYGVTLVTDRATEIDAAAKRIALESGDTIAYDKVVVAPGVDLRMDTVEGYDEAATEIMPHAWKAGPQTELLRRQIESTERGALFVLAPPPNPYRCPPGPYERVCSIAHQLKQRNPSAKILVLDAKDKFSKQQLFQDAWDRYYTGMIEWVPAEFGGAVTRVDTDAMTVTAGDETHRVAFANIIPAQTAGAIAHRSGLGGANGWCPIVSITMQSRFDEDIYVVGDATEAGDMPKSAYSANSQAKVCAMSIRAELTGARLFPPRLRNTCWSTLAPNDAVKVGAHYEATEDSIATVASFVSTSGEDESLRARSSTEADAWYDGITADIFG